ncbi:MAG: ATP-binding cassette domain-containing protein [Chloroflexi bacterium]|jgi:ABC-type multidrug transport system fused ATPase/permease subunit|nr:ATP-binding cassette domain-containing protein [Chloroflexota bacterium]
MGFILGGLETEDYDRQYGDRELLDRIISYFRPYTRQMILVAVMITLNSAATIAGPILIARAIDMLTEDTSNEALLLLTLGIGILGVSAWVFNFIRQWFSARVTGNVVLQLRQDVFMATVGHDMSFYDEHPSGKIVSRITSDTQDFSEVVNLTLNLVSQVLLVILITLWLFMINVWLTLLLIALTPVVVIGALSFRRLARRVTQNARRVTAVINAQIQESISGIVVAKSFRQEPAIYASFDENNQQGYKMGLQRGMTLMAIFPLMGLIAGFGTALLLFAGGMATANPASGVSTGDWYLYMQAVGFYWFPMMNIASFWSQFQDGLSASERVFALIDAEPKVEQTAHEPVGKLNGRVQFQDVRFSYTDKEVVLPDFSLDIKAGETLALVGHTGAGKSSIAKIIMRFYEYQGGQILIDGRDIRKLDLSQFRLQTGLVPQEPFLFSGTVGENIRYGRPTSTDEDIRRAAMQVSQGEWLDALSNGLDTDVGERGGSLSMGQRQLVALARVVLKDPSIFILDEATASVDPFTEMQIQEGLDTIMRDRTAIVIAHRLSTIRNADRIIVMDNGRILEEGTHDSLLASSGHYADLYNTYFRHQSLEAIEAPEWLEDPEGIGATAD